MDIAQPPLGGVRHDFPTILLIEDDADVRAVIRRALEPEGCAVVEAESGIEGLRIVETDIPPLDAVVTGLRMAGVDGYDVAEVLAEHRPDLPVVVITGGNVSCSRLGAVKAVLLKPFLPDDLVGVISPLVHAARTMRAAARRQRADAQEAWHLARLQRDRAVAQKARAQDLVGRALALHARMRGH